MLLINLCFLGTNGAAQHFTPSPVEEISSSLRVESKDLAWTGLRPTDELWDLRTALLVVHESLSAHRHHMRLDRVRKEDKDERMKSLPRGKHHSGEKKRKRRDMENSMHHVEFACFSLCSPSAHPNCKPRYAVAAQNLSHQVSKPHNLSETNKGKK